MAQARGRSESIETGIRIEPDQRDLFISADVETAANPIRPPARHVIVGSDGVVAATGNGKWEPDGRFAATLPAGLSPGNYTLFTAIFADGNSIDPSIGSIAFGTRRMAGGSSKTCG